jgi:branched-subunit amino acid ABC-type transport system permease component
VIDFVILGIVVGISYGLLALPLSLLFIATGTVDFALGAYAVLAGLVCYMVGGPFGMAAGVLSAVAAASIVGIVSRLLDHKRRTDHLTLVLASFGFAIFLESLVLSTFGEQPYVRHPFSDYWDLFGVRVSPQAGVNLLAALTVLAVTFALLYATPIGRMMRASAVNPRGATLAGIPVHMMRASTFVFAGLLAGVAGVLHLYTSGLSYSSGMHLALSGFGAAIIFGLKSPLRAFLGGIAIGIVESLSNGYLPSHAATLVPLLFIFTVLIVQGTSRTLSGGRA